MSIEIEIYSKGLVSCSVCVAESATRNEIEDAVNAKNPTGISSRWHISDDAKFANGTPNPNPCEARDGHLHYLLNC